MYGYTTCITTNFVSHTFIDWKKLYSEKRMFIRKNHSHIGTWLAVDEEDKTVQYCVDPKWLKNSSDEEQKIELAKLTALATVYRRTGYAVSKMSGRSR
jgi:hypothetical protein